MYSYTWDSETGGLHLNSSPLQFSKEPRPVYWRELDLLGFDKYWKYPHDDSAPIMWAEANNYIYRGRPLAKVIGGSMFTPPTIEIIEELKGEDATLMPVDIEEMCKRNKNAINILTEQTIQTIYNIYIQYKDKVEIFHVSYSGGKDSEVCLDLVQKALPHNSFVVIFGDTQMEFPDTYDIVKAAKDRCEESTDGFIAFHTSSAPVHPLTTWKKFGPPSSAIRWCCTVHKTAPQLIKLREIVGKDDFSEMAFVGVRAAESTRRSEYDMIAYGMKHKGQYSCYPILQWNSAEIYLYLYVNELPINAAYKKGISRAGCIVCPLSASKNNFFNNACYPELAAPFIKIISDTYENDNKSDKVVKSYLENVGWKARKSGRDLNIADNKYAENDDGNILKISFSDPYLLWKEWIKTLGDVTPHSDSEYTIIFQHKPFKFIVQQEHEPNLYSVTISSGDYKNETEFIKRFRRIFRKSHFCKGCRVCQANCRHGNLHISENYVKVSDTCIHCGECLDIDTGCLVYKSLWYPKNKGKMKEKSIDCYMTHPTRMDWMQQFVQLKDDFMQNHSLGNNQLTNFKRFLRDAGILSGKSETVLCGMLRENGLEDDNIWALMLVNLAHSPQVGWMISNFGFGDQFTQKQMKDTLSMNPAVSKTGISCIPNTLRRMTVLPIGRMGMGIEVDENKSEGFTLLRQPYRDLDPRVLLYALYKYAEACGDFKQFTMSRLYDESIDSDGVSPVRIFGTEEEDMEKMLKGLSITYPEYINVSFTHDLDTITLKDDKSSEDVLTLF